MIFSFAVVMVFMVIAWSRPAATIMLPDPDAGHKFKVAVSHFPLTDTATNDAYDATVKRSIMASLFIPVARDACANECKNSYMPGQTARIANEQFILGTKEGVFETIGYNHCCGNDADIDASKLSVVVLEPHTDTSRLLYVNVARFISANGIAVVVLDHPGETSITEFSGTNVPRGGTVYNSGTVELSNFSPVTAWNDTISKAIATRMTDINFALTQLSTLELLQRQLPTLRFSTPLNTKNFSVIGHGLGGTVATALSFANPNVRFSINLSGAAPSIDSTGTSTIATPVYFFGRSNYKRTDAFNWPATWSHLTGPATEFDLNNSDIFDFSDLPVIVELAQNEGGKKGVSARAVAGGSSANHAMLCFVEAVVKKEVLGDAGTLSNCVRVFPGMVPFLGQ
ncbi:hypothetical protein NX059_010427 [Plenodomus lindquistii]|nr:hypothetical protein NX059_010427 [Plenodomus lindquistii]